MTYLIEYLGEFEFIFETVLGYLSGDQMGSFEAKKTESKISCLGTFKNTWDGGHIKNFYFPVAVTQPVVNSYSFSFC